MRIEKTNTYMEPVTFVDGHGFRTIVSLSTGGHALISEVHRLVNDRMPLDETMVFLCDPEGNVKDWSEIYCASSTSEALGGVDQWSLNLAASY
jgi:hypothetical protein